MSFEPPMDMPNLLQQITGILETHTNSLNQLLADAAALRLTAMALCQTHPEPAKALEVFLSHQDALAVALPAAQLPMYGAAVQQYRAILEKALPGH